MCDRCGNTHEKIMEASRRGFLKTGFGALAAIALPSGAVQLMGAGEAFAADATTLKATHGSGLCNLGIFLAKERKLAEADNVNLEFVVAPTTTDVVTLLARASLMCQSFPIRISLRWLIRALRSRSWRVQACRAACWLPLKASPMPQA